MSKGFWLIIAAVVVVFGGILLFKDDEAKAPTNGSAASNHVVGDNAKGVTLIEYGDFQCFFCAQYMPIVEQVKEKYKADIAFQFRNLPLVQNHKNAFASSRAAEAASLQNKYWEMYAILFQNQSAWGESNDPLSIFEQYASQLGLNVEQFKTDFASSKVNDTINADIEEFKKTKEQIKTPTFFLDGKKIEPKSLEEFSTLIDQAIAAKSGQQ
ncbi:MAG TPA: thioredoxin domain-containing protein [Candidatus Saccharimonadales bacterium]|nr:thioredoxin domain-containing protein [Candidatus Saccharimonadales bacterium]